MKLLRKYQIFAIAFGILFWGFAKIIGIQEWGTIILWISIIVFRADDIIKYEKDIGIVKFAILSSIFVVICGLTALIIIQIGNHFTLSTTFKIIIVIFIILIDVSIIGYLKKKLEIKR